MAASEWHPLQPKLFHRTGSVPEIIDIAEGSAQTFKAGTPVKLSSNQIVIGTDGTCGFVGIAQETASGTQTTLRKVMLAIPEITIVRCYCVNNGTATASDNFSVGETYGWYIDTTDYWFAADSNDTSTKTLIFVEPEYDSTGAATYWGRFLVFPGQAGNIDEEAA